MPKISDEPLEAIQLRLFKKDLDHLRRFYGSNVGVNKVIRNLVRSLVIHNESHANSLIDLSETSGELFVPVMEKEINLCL